MTPAARVQAAIEILDLWREGEPAERVLTRWARSNRYAGSGDRAAVRDLVFAALRRGRSSIVLGGASGRGMMLGLFRGRGEDPAPYFTGARHGPKPIRPQEAPGDLTELDALDCPDWLAPRLRASLEEDFAPVLNMLRDRAQVFIRANARSVTRKALAEELAAEGIETTPHPMAPMALAVGEGARRLNGTRAFAEGRFELQDVASQAVADALPVHGRVLDYCAGGGGKTLAMAARAEAQFFAHDALPRRMSDLPVRAARAGVEVTCLTPKELNGSFDLVLADAPCSGSGAWRRSPEGKWRLTEARLIELCNLQMNILDQAAELVTETGVLAYATCSLLREENEAQTEAFLARSPGWRLLASRRFSPLDGGDGFFLAQFTRG